MFSRRSLILTASVMVFTCTARAEGRVRLVGVLLPSDTEALGSYVTAFENRLINLNPDARTVVHSFREAGSLSEAALTLLQKRPEVVLATNTAAVRSVRAHDKTTPVVFVTAFDPVQLGLTDSISRPNHNTTGIQGNLETLPGKQLELAREIFPNVKTFAVLVNTRNISVSAQRRAYAEAARDVGLEPKWFDVGAMQDIGELMRQVAESNAEFLLLPTDAVVFAQRKQIIEHASRHNLSVVGSRREFTDDGALMSYGHDLRANYVRAAELVARILAGSKISDIPIELPARVDLSMNSTAAKRLRITVPESLWVRADIVIE